MKLRLLVIFLLLLTFNIYAANINVDELKVVSVGEYLSTTGQFNMNTYFNFVASFNGGYKFAAKTTFAANTYQISNTFLDSSADFYNKVFLVFNGVEVTARNLFNSHFFITFWTGNYKYLGAGSVYKGYLYFPKTQDDDYKGMYRLRGAGVSSEIRFWEEKFKASLHVYQNTNFVTSATPNAFNYFSFDLEAGIFLKYFSLEIFGGYTKDFINPNTNAYLKYGRGKAGLTMRIGDGINVDFFAAGGLTNIDDRLVNNLKLGNYGVFDIFYISAEFHFKLFVTDHIISFLTRPLFFNEKRMKNMTDIDANYKFNVSVADFPINGGFILNFNYSVEDPNDTWKLCLSPYMLIKSSGVVWTINVHYDFSRISVAIAAGDNYLALDGLKLVLGVSSSF
ncbi:MAG TPA: hypothetical protein PLG34_04945 [Spirochaetota bacterium]|nr:MAG: hypothetical protein BWX91_02148 [Spirochaetes bacterium ADurb.Bin133]HNZ27600.1 hypothetical protein [Spirochaetota bacterium]HPY87309.1 hypothetical protein [Spirochaetota bacterium]